MSELRSSFLIAPLCHRTMPSTMNETAEEDFVATLLQDAIAAIERHQIATTQLSRRDLVRTLFAASEGLIWAFRQHVCEAAEETGNLGEAEAIALREEIHFVTNNGTVSTQKRYIPLTASIRLVARIAKRLDSELSFSFEQPGWQDFRVFVDIRNRLTHPKSSTDLQISTKEADTCMSGFFWLTEIVVQSMEVANLARQKHLAEFTRVLEGLQAGDPLTLALYRRAFLEDGDS